MRRTAMALASIVFLLAACAGPLNAQPRRGGEARLASAGGGAVRALVIGIDHYKHAEFINQLNGAVADAIDLADALRRGGVGDLTLLLESEATRANIEAAFERLIATAADGDLVILTFAGHGSQEDERIPGSEPDGKDEVFLLWGFGLDGEDTRERLIDDEVYDYLKRLGARGAHILFLADSCHGGGMTKSVDPRGSKLSVRGMEAVSSPEQATRGKYYLPRSKDRLILPPTLAPDDDATKELPNLTFLGAVEPHVLAPEIKIHGIESMRGAASYTLARALEGAADAEGNRDGRTTRRELLSFMRKSVRNITQNWQNPILEPHLDDSLRQVVFLNGQPTKPEGVLAKSVEAIKVAIFGATPSAPTGARSGRVAYEVVRGGASGADITFDATTRDFIDRSGSVLAYDSTPERLSSVVDRVSAGRQLASLAGGRALDIWLTPHEKDLIAGEQFKLNIGEAAGRHLIMVNIAGDGKLQYLFPSGAVDPQVTEETKTFDLVVLPPFGTDLMVVIATARRQPALEQKLKLLNDKWDPLALVEAAAAHLGADDRLGMVSYTTRPTKR
jgi:hypothetical protein